MTWIFTQRSEERLNDIHPELTKIVRLALSLSPLDFVVIEGRRSRARQRALMAIGASRTQRSRHITGHAVDLGPWINGAIPWDDWKAFEQVARAMKQAAWQLNIPLTWGGDWVNFRDGPHFELPREAYP
jgi:peptidoglycan L-alanyl-D-glutamate endopeptidase CwlK